MNQMVGVGERIAYLCDEAQALAQGTPVAAKVDLIRQRINEPLRVAIAGRVKAGKSTLLNALVGERLAPTDAGECTRIVSWYRRGPGYDVRARLYHGGWQDLRFRRDDGALEIELGLLTPAEIERLEVAWPSSRLDRMTLIDTPGLASLDDHSSARTRDFLALEDEERQSDADAVIYLMRHMHRRDAEFLEAFYDTTVVGASPVNAIGVLSRADEIGAGRLDALDSAAAIAERYRSDERIRALCATVLPVAGLIAETGATLEEREAAALRDLAALPEDDLRRLLISVDRFRESSVTDLLVETREWLLQRLGLFGVRLAVQLIRSGEATSAVDLSQRLIRVSGLDQLRELLETHFTTRAQALKGRTALSGLRSCARELQEVDSAGASRLLAEIERVESSTHAFAELRLLHMVLTGTIQLNDEERQEIGRLIGEGSPAVRAGCDSDADAEAIKQAVLAGIARWRQRAANPLIDRQTADAFEIAARSYEGIYATLATL